MAGGPRLKVRFRARLLALLAVVLLAHTVALQWLASQLQPLATLTPLPQPMFTRVLRQQTPVPVAAAPMTAAARPRRQHAAVSSLAPPAAAASASSAPEPAQAPAPAPEPAPPPVPPDPMVAAAEATARESLAQAQAAAAAASAAASLDSWPVDTRLNYRLGGQFRSGELHGSARVQWQRVADRYQTRIEIDVTLLAGLVLTSQGEVTAQGLFPRAYEELRRGGPRKARLDDDAVVLGDGRRLPRPAGVQDTASQFVELSHRFATGQDTLEVGRSVSLWLARPGGVDLWTYDIVGRETLRSTELGAIDAFHLKPRPIANPRGNITAEIWFAPSLQYLPVRIRVGMGADTHVDLLVEKIEQR